MGHIRQFTKLSKRIGLYWKKFRPSIIITCVGLMIYLCLFTKTFNIQRIKQSLNDYQQRSITIGGFYHFATKGTRWKGIVAEQVLLAQLSGLVAASSVIYVTGLGKIQDNETAYNFLQDSKFIYEFDTRMDLWEFPTLRKLEKFCAQNNHSFVWYAHSKAASHEDNDMGAWRDVMNYFVLDGWHHCYDLLSTTNYNTCGAILTYDSVRRPGWNTYYAGNMWWAKCSHVNRLTRLENIDQKDHYNAEFYITSEPAEGHFNCFNTAPTITIVLNRKNASCTVNQPMWKVR